MQRFECSALEPDNLLAFLALLGTLRAVEASRPEWSPRASWEGVPPRAVIHLAKDVSETALFEALCDGIASFAEAYAFIADDIKFSESEFRELAADATTIERADVLAALCSDGALRRKEDQVEATPLCTMFGSGWQNFLRRLNNAAVAETHPDQLRRALFVPWTYEDIGESFRWDPIEDRRYAYQAGNPSETANKIGTVTGANRLAAIGFGRWACAPGSGGLVTLGTTRSGSDRFISWPLNDVPASLDALVALLGHPTIVKDNSVKLRAYGVPRVARARRYQNGKYFNIARATIH